MTKNKDELVFEWEKCKPAPEVEADPHQPTWFDAEKAKLDWDEEVKELEAEIEKLKAQNNPSLDEKIKQLEEDIHATNIFYHWAIYD